MKKMKCPQCMIERFRVKNTAGESVVVTVTVNLQIEPIYPDVSLEGFDLDVLYCLGCSWKGSPRQLSSKH